MHTKSVNGKVGNFRMWKSGKQWLFGASVLVAITMGSSIPVLAQEIVPTPSSGIETTVAKTMVVPEPSVSEVGPEIEDSSNEAKAEMEATSSFLPEAHGSELVDTGQEPSVLEVGPEIEDSSNEAKAEMEATSSFLSEAPVNESVDTGQEPITESDQTIVKSGEQSVLQSKALKSDEKEQTPPEISENQEWTHGVSKPNKGDFVWQKEVYQGYYTAPYKDGSQLFDVNKDYTQSSGDFGLCSAGVAANMLHWWLENNKNYVERYLQESATNGVVAPAAHAPIDLREHKKYIGDKHKSELFELFKSYFPGQAVYTHRVLDLFFSGYPDARKYQVNQETDYSDKDAKGHLDARGGFFKDVFEQHLLTSLEDVSDYATIGTKIKQAITEKKTLAIDYLFNKSRGHIVNVWGADFDEKGQLTALYVTDTDDYTSVINGKGDALQSLKRYTVVNRDGKAYISNNYDSKGGVGIRNLYTLDLGEQHWQAYFSKSEKERNQAIRKKIMDTVRAVKNKTELVEVSKRPWGGGFSEQDLELLQTIHKGEFTEEEFESVRAKALETLSIMQGQSQWDGRFPSPGMKLPGRTTQPTPQIPEATTELDPVSPVSSDDEIVRVVSPSTPDSKRDLHPQSPEITPESPSTEGGATTELDPVSPVSSDDEIVRVVSPSTPDSKRDLHPQSPEITPESPSTEGETITELDPVSPVSSDDKIVRVVSPSTPDSKRDLLPQSPEVTPKSPSTKIGAKTERDPKQDEISARIDSKVALPPVSPASSDNEAARVVRPATPEVTPGPKRDLLSQIPEVTPESSSTEVGVKTDSSQRNVPSHGRESENKVVASTSKQASETKAGIQSKVSHSAFATTKEPKNMRSFYSNRHLYYLLGALIAILAGLWSLRQRKK